MTTKHKPGTAYCECYDCTFTPAAKEGESLAHPSGSETTPAELVEALKEMNRHIEALESCAAATGRFLTAVDAIQHRQRILDALLACSQNKRP